MVDKFSMYRLMNPGIKGNDKHVWRHWCSFGRYENRSIHFDYTTFVEVEYGDYEEETEAAFIRDPIVAKEYCVQIPYSDDTNVKIIHQYKELMFDTKYYTTLYMKQDTNFYEAYRHYMQIGQKHGFKITDFVWIDYLLLNPTLIGMGITTADQAVRHWINYGKQENRFYKL